MTGFAALLAIALASAPPVPETREELSALARTAALSYCATAPSLHIEKTPSVTFPEHSEFTFVRECEEGRTLILFSSAASLPDGYLPLMLEVRSPTALLPAALQVGAPTSCLEGLLGHPDAESEGSLHYVLTESEDTLTIETAGGRVTRMVWTFYSG